jgi:predicted TPR repeat methyltransferase
LEGDKTDGAGMSATRSVNVGEAFGLAMAAYDEGKPAEARRIARGLVEAHPNFGGAHYLLGLISLDQGQAKRASEHLIEAVARSPAEAVPRLALGRAQEMLGNLYTAILQYRTILTQDADHAEANARLGELLCRSGHADEALAHCRRAVAINPRHAEALNTLGTLLHRQGDDGEAAEHLRRACELRPDWAVALNNYGAVLRGLGHRKDAAAILAGAVELRRDHAGTRANLAGALRELGRVDEARVQAERAVKHDPRCAEAWLELGLARQSQGHAEGAAAAFERAVAVAAEMVDAHWCLAETRRALGQLDRAAAHYRRCLDLDPDDRHGAALGLALTGGMPVPERAPEAYVRQLFDDYADNFDHALVEKLDYRAPELLADALRRVLGDASGLDVLDAGCGTGLAAPVLKPRAKHLDGVDLSAAMVEKAAARGLYDRLDVAELVATLAARPQAYDLVVAADVLVYLGDLQPMMAAAGTALRPDGTFAFTVERADGDASYALGPKHRYAHAPRYIREVAEAGGFAVALLEDAVTRRDGAADVPGSVVVLRRLSATAPI